MLILANINIYTFTRAVPVRGPLPVLKAHYGELCNASDTLLVRFHHDKFVELWVHRTMDINIKARLMTAFDSLSLSFS